MLTTNPQIEAFTARNFPEVSTLDARGKFLKRFKRGILAVSTGGASEAARAMKRKRTARSATPAQRAAARSMIRVGRRPRFGAYDGTVPGGMVPVSGANPTMAAWDYDMAPGIGKSWLAKRLKVTSKTFAKLKPSGIFKTALDVVAPGSSAVIGKIAKTGQKVMTSKENAASIKKAAQKAIDDAAAKAAAARDAIRNAPSQAERLVAQETLVAANKELKAVEAQAATLVSNVVTTPAQAGAPATVPAAVAADMQPARSAAAVASDAAAEAASPSVATRRKGMSAKTMGLIGGGVALVVLLVLMRRK
jgi:hypothetical protein